MSKNTIKKIILTIIILTVLILSLIFFHRITSEDHPENITITKKIIKEKYEDVVYFEDSNYLYAYNDNEYTVFDYNGNKLYTIKNVNKEDIVTVSEKYFIVKDNNYHLYNPAGEEIIFGNNMYPISDYLISVDNNIVNEKGDILFYNVKNIKSYYKNKYFLIDNYFTNEKGKVLLVDYKIIKEKVNNNEIDYFIVKKNSEYYCFFPIVNNIIGDGFEKYFEYDDKIYIVSNNKMYMIYMSGLRKEITFTINKNINKNNIDYSNAVRKNQILTYRDYYLGLLETDTNKFYRIMKTKDFSFNFIDNNYIKITANNKNYVYDLNNKKIVYSNHFDDIIIFKNGYKTIKKDKQYYLLDNKDRIITTSDKQIIPLNSKIKIGKSNKKIVIYDKGLYPGERITINDKDYYKYDKEDNKYIVSSDLKEKYESNLYLNYMKNTIVQLENDKIYFYDRKKDRIYIYKIEDYRIVNDEIHKNELILSNDKNIIVLGEKANVIKKIKNVKLENIYYSKNKQAIIAIVEKDTMFNKYNGAYVFK